jgi:hypothetical protein
VLQNPADGKLCVTVLHRRANASQIQDCSYQHVCVDPWELVLTKPSECAEIRELQV